MLLGNALTGKGFMRAEKGVVRAAKGAVRTGRGCNNKNHIDKNFQSRTIL